MNAIAPQVKQQKGVFEVAKHRHQLVGSLNRFVRLLKFAFSDLSESLMRSRYRTLC
jgi:hypothetical protein